MCIDYKLVFIYLLIKNLIVKLSMRFKNINYGFTRPSYGLIWSIACFKYINYGFTRPTYGLICSIA